MFTLSQLESFVVVAEELHYGRAADRLSMTQPPLSRRILLLERELGVQLFDRSGRAVRLTAAGRSLLGDARRLLGRAQQAAAAVRRVGAGQAGTVALGFTATTAYSFLETVLSGLRDRLPDVDVVLREQVTGAQLELLRAGALDVGLLRPPVTEPGMRSAPISREPLFAAVPAAHALAATSGPVDVQDLDGEPFVMYSPVEARYFHEVVTAVFRSAGIAPRSVQHLSQVHTILALVAAGLGLALVPAAAQRLHLPDVVLLPVAGIAGEPVELVAAWQADNDNPVLPHVLDVLREVG